MNERNVDRIEKDTILFPRMNPVSLVPQHMASNSNIDIEDATQHLRDILKLDRPGNTTGKLDRE